MEIERLSAKVDVDTFAAERALDSLDHKLDQVARDRTARVNIFYNEHGDTRGGLLGGRGGGGGVPGPWGAPNAADRRIGPSGLFPGREVDFGTGEIIGSLTQLADAGEDVLDVFDELPKVFIPATEHLKNLANQSQGASDGLNQVAGAGSAAGGGMGMMAAKAGILAGVLFLLLPAIVAIGPAILALGGYVIGLVGAFAPLVGLLFTLPALIGGLVGVFGVLMLAIKPLIEAVGWLGKAEEEHKANVEAEARAVQLLASARHAQEIATRNNAAATINLAKAHKQAAEDIEDAQLSARAAVLGEERAILTLERAYKRLAEVQSGIVGKTSEITKEVDYFTGKQVEVARITYDAADSQQDLADALLSVKEAELGVQIAQDNREDTAARLAELERKGVENSDAVVAAQQALADSTWALEEANRAVTDAYAARQEAAVNLATEGEALDKLGTKSEELAKRIKGLLDNFSTLGLDLLEIISPALLDTLDSLQPFLDSLSPILTPIAEGIGKLVSSFSEQFFTDENIDKMIEFSTSFGALLGLLGPILATFAEGILNLMIQSMPLIERIIGMLGEGADNFVEWTEGGSDVGDLAKWFELTGDVLEKTLSIMGSLIEFTTAFLVAMLPFSTWVLDSLVEGSQAMEDWAESAEGQKSIGEFFESIKAPLQAIGSLLAAFGTGFMEVFGSQEAMDFLTRFIEVTENDVLPLFLGLFDVLIKSGFLTGIVELVGSLAALFKGIAAFNGMEDMLSMMGSLMELTAIVFEGVGGILEIMALLSPEAWLNKGTAWLLDLFDLDGVRDAIGEWFAKLPEYLATLGGMINWAGMWEGMKSAFSSAIDWIEGLFSTVWDKIASTINSGLGPLNKGLGWLGLDGVPEVPTWAELMNKDEPQAQFEGSEGIPMPGRQGQGPVPLTDQQIDDILAAAAISSGMSGGGTQSHVPPGGPAVYMTNNFPEGTDYAEASHEIAWQVTNTRPRVGTVNPRLS